MTSMQALRGVVVVGRQSTVQVRAAKPKDSSPWSTGGPKRNSGKGGSSGAGSAGSGEGSGRSQPEQGSGSLWKDAPGPRHTSKSWPVKGPKGGAGFGASRSPARPAPAPEVTITDPISVTLLDELTPSEAAAEPRWGTFCSHLHGEWVGQYAAYTPWEGKPEPAWMDERGKYVTVVYCRALEHRYVAAPGPGAGEEGAGADAAAGAAGEAPTDVLLRKIGRSTRLASLPDLVLPPEGAGLAGGAGSDGEGEGGQGQEDMDVEALAFNTDGIVVFDGGNYSAGPEYIGTQEVKLVADEALEEAPAGPVLGQGGEAGGRGSDSDEEEGEDEDGSSSLLPTATSVMESCLVEWGSKTRVRAKLTLRIGRLDSGEVDVEVLRLLLFREQWVGPPDHARLAAPLNAIRSLDAPCTGLPRPQPGQMQGAWNVFTVCATGVDEEDPLTGEERVSWVYSGGEEQQLWDASAAPPGGDGGGAYWLPGGVLVTLRMSDAYVPEGEGEGGSGADSEEEGAGSAAASNGNGKGHGGGGSGSRDGVAGAEGEPEAVPRGLVLGLSWQWADGAVSAIEREYDGWGYLREVRLSQAVRGGWAGGRM